MPKGVALLITLLLSAQALPGQHVPPPKFSATVQLLLQCDDAPLKSQFTSYLSRELRSLGDVAIVEEKPDFQISAIIMTIQTREDESPRGFVIAVRTTKPETTEWWTAEWLKRFLGVVGVEKLKLDLLKVEHEGDMHNLQFSLATGSLDHVQQTCLQIIADFDTEVLGPERKLWDLTHR